MRKIAEIFLGIMAALGGFLDVGEIVYTVQAGSRFTYTLIWPILVGTIGIIVFGEMSGRVSAITKKATFDLIREWLPMWAGVVLLAASSIIAVLTCAAELGGVSIILQILTGWPLKLTLVLGALVLFLVVWSFRFEWIERLFGFMGLGTLMFVAAAVAAHPNWDKIAHGLLPMPEFFKTQVPSVTYGYFAVGLIGTLLLPYEVYFYSSGAIEDKWKEDDLPINTLTAVVGFVLGGGVAVALMVCGAEYFYGRNVFSQQVAASILPVSLSFGKWAMFAVLLGILFSLGGAAVETSLSIGYNVCQYFDFNWGKDKPVMEVKLFTFCWGVSLLIGMALNLFGFSVINMVEYAVMSSLLILPLSYYPILRTAQSRKEMGKHKNHLLDDILGWGYFVILLVVAVAAVPLLILSHAGMK